MSNPFNRPTGGGGVFKSAEALNDLAIIFEPKSIAKNVPNTYNGQTKNRDEVTCDITVFGTSESLEKGEPTAVLKGVRVVHGMICSELERNLPDSEGNNGGVVCAVVRKVPTKGGSGYALRPAAEQHEELAAKWYTEKEAAIAEAMADVPSFE